MADRPASTRGRGPMVKVFARPDRNPVATSLNKSAPPKFEDAPGSTSSTVAPAAVSSFGSGDPIAATLLSLEATLRAMDDIDVASAAASKSKSKSNTGGRPKRDAKPAAGRSKTGSIETGRSETRAASFGGPNYVPSLSRSGVPAASAPGANDLPSLVERARDDRGVYVARDLWNAIRVNLDDHLAIKNSEGMTVSELRRDVAKAQSRAREFEVKYRQCERVVSGDQKDLAERAAQLQDELAVVKRERNKMKEAHEAQIDTLNAMLASRDTPAGAKSDELRASLDDASFRLKLENARLDQSTSRVDALEMESEYLRERHAADVLAMEELEGRYREAMARLEEARATTTTTSDGSGGAASAGAGAGSTPNANASTAAEERLRLDNRRLVALLERTAEFKRLVRDTAKLDGMHYVTLSEMLQKKNATSERYPPLRDRGGASDGISDGGDYADEGANWVPKETLRLTKAFLKDVVPKVPLGPFMTLLLDLNAAWRAHEAAVLAETKKRHASDVNRIKARDPHREIVLENTVMHMKKQLQRARKDKIALDELRAAAAKRAEKGAAGDGGGDDENKVLLEWALATIETLSKQVADTMRANKTLKSRLVALGGRDAPLMAAGSGAGAGAGGGVKGAAGYSSDGYDDEAGGEVATDAEIILPRMTTSTSRRTPPSYAPGDGVPAPDPYVPPEAATAAAPGVSVTRHEMKPTRGRARSVAGGRVGANPSYSWAGCDVGGGSGVGVAVRRGKGGGKGGKGSALDGYFVSG
ncbi:uncharacterized protein MICPUCDRAFT_53881 [Micromonas pusilla CCMP1545]|uniref:Predicted protein n=1 Tax=Micromonas pusilla (strain CCMP1545) TaxID=564608 RepID=C1N7Y9_MICPC|nr:uncharacterized protein MICPUCDRAFT_53881 [Micromonas pusilla CCMP1545]EEH51799.1 predicted protein [Micromonas pusilla CCMP1545]|eukprot:XP_003064177.1 predicted protein [Micromonas pusilla CCMP1545]